ncbi:hypothetical protein RHS01_11400 [Rhizoctonia solani]|uniref:Uncharacterized protein n=1 Tax=Rhizoctonia solani TaxID=456999 RepID=A0A8H7I366_9AGAM|nr:hypothetical protein RHS01_11400 [Rhizoctonia solani]
MSFAQSFYCFPIFTTYRNDVPLSPETGIIEANHVRDLYYIYANRHNDHPSPYSENHPDPLERRIHAMPDVEVFLMADDHPPQWFLGVDLAHALHGAYYHALQVFGDAVQPTGWNCHDPWGNYDYASKLEEINFPYIPCPICFTRDLYHFPFDTFHELQRQVHHNNFYVICLNALSIIINATKQNHYSNLAHVGYIRGSPACVSAHRFWCRLHGHPVIDGSEDDLSDAGFPINGYDADDESLGPLTPPTEVSCRLPLHAASNAGEYPAPPNSSNYELDVNALTEQLAQVAVVQDANPAPPSFSADFVESIWEWPGEPQPVADLGPPEWPSVPQQHTPPFSWEDHWHEVRARNLRTEGDMDFDIGGGIEINANHVIQTRPVASN